MRDDMREDDKIIAIHVDDPEYTAYQDVADLPPHRVRELEQFFLDYKELDGKRVTIDGVRGRVHAEQVIRNAAGAYREAFATSRGIRNRASITREAPTMTIDLTSEQLEVLRDSLEIYLTEFRREVAGTENPEMRHRLQHKQNALESILSRLGRKTAA
jgi:hypothetical protein